ncbi:VENN motif pre-toxin domain-containing protein, partial [Serratia liquefaciens]
INGLQKAKDKHPGLDAKALRKTPEYQAEMQKYGTGSDMQRAAQAVTGALQALAGNNLAGALASGAAPYLAKEIKARVGENNVAANAMAHALLGAITAQLNNQSAVAGAVGAGGGELAARVIVEIRFPGRDISSLTEGEKQEVSALSQLAAGLAGGIASDGTAGAVVASQAGKNAVENNHLSSTQALTFDKELSDCRKSGGDCQTVIDKWKAVSDGQSVETDQKLKDNPLEAQVIDKETALGGYDMTQRPGWLNNIGADVMTSEEAKAYVQQWNGQDLANIDVNSPGWTKFAAFVSDPENQAAVASFAKISKDVVQLAKAAITSQSYPVTIKSLQVGLRNPDYVDKLKKDMLGGDFKFTDPKGKIAGYVDAQGRYYITEGNHRMVAAQEIYKQTGDAKYIDQLLRNGVWTQSKNAPAGSVPMPKR